MNEKVFLFLLIFLWVRSTPIEFPTPQWIVWNVGQGQWITLVYSHHCFHFDFGGEKNPIKEVYQYCAWRDNRLILSHPDRDHYNFIKSIREKFKNLCLEGPSWKNIKLNQLGFSNIKKCNRISYSSLNSNNLPDLGPNSFFQTQNRRILYQRNQQKKPKSDKNLKSQIYHSQHWLIPGDAPQVVEKDWLGKTLNKEKNSLTHLILGHHGSKTSTSLELLQGLPKLTQCVSSSREKKYGHPHPTVQIRLRPYCGLIKTEDWNHIHFLLN